MKIEPFTIPSEITVSCIDLKYQEGPHARWLFFLKIKERWRTHLCFFSKFTTQTTYAEVALPAHLSDTPEHAWYNVQGVIEAGHWLNKPRLKK